MALVGIWPARRSSSSVGRQALVSWPWSPWWLRGSGVFARRSGDVPVHLHGPDGPSSRSHSPLRRWVSAPPVSSPHAVPRSTPVGLGQLSRDIIRRGSSPSRRRPQRWVSWPSSATSSADDVWTRRTGGSSPGRSPAGLVSWVSHDLRSPLAAVTPWPRSTEGQWSTSRPTCGATPGHRRRGRPLDVARRRPVRAQPRITSGVLARETGRSGRARRRRRRRRVVVGLRWRTVRLRPTSMGPRGCGSPANHQVLRNLSPDSAVRRTPEGGTVLTVTVSIAWLSEAVMRGHRRVRRDPRADDLDALDVAFRGDVAVAGTPAEVGWA